MQARVTIGRPELERLYRGEPVVIHLKEGTSELRLEASTMAKDALRTGVGPKSALEEVLGRIRKDK